MRKFMRGVAYVVLCAAVGAVSIVNNVPLGGALVIFLIGAWAFASREGEG